MKRTVITILTVALVAGFAQSVSAQFYNTGQAPFAQRWNRIATDSIEVIYHTDYAVGARSVLHFMESVRPSIGWGLNERVMPMPVVLKSENFNSNGLTIWAPKRIEIVTIPEWDDCYALPWIKQLSVHEYRHAAQYTALNHSTIRAVACFFGQQWQLLTTGLMPFWWLEGDAVDAETQFADFGRGLQPSYSMHYRALGSDILRRRNPDRWFGGSYRDYVPNHYLLGYQMVTYANTRFDRYVWDDVVRYSSRFPFLVFTAQLGMRHSMERMGTVKLFRETFTDLNRYWDSLPPQSDSAERIEVEPNSYAHYRWPLFDDESNIVALMSDMDRSSRFVQINPSNGNERVIGRTGTVGSRPTISNGRIYWTELRRSTFWEQRVNSVICSMNVNGRRKRRTEHKERTALFAERIDNQTAYARYDYTGSFEIVVGDKRFALPQFETVNGLAFDSATRLLYFIYTSDAGMGIDAIDPQSGSRTTVKGPSTVTLSSLSASNGKLMFGSIESGRDQVNVIDIATGEEYRTTTAQFGAFDGSIDKTGTTMALTLYDRRGYLPAIQRLTELQKVKWSRLPRNVVNPPRFEWNAMKIDSVRFTTSDSEQSERQIPERRYRRAKHLFRFHSWAPVSYNPDEAMDGDYNNIKFGLSTFSQNLLGTATTTLNAGFNEGWSKFGQAKINYMGFAPKLTASIYVDDTPRLSSSIVYPVDSLQQLAVTWFDRGDLYFKPTTEQGALQQRKNYVRTYLRIYLPIMLSGGFHTAYLTPNLEYRYTNTPVYNSSKKRYSGGSNMLYGSLTFIDNLRTAERDLLPRLGVMAKFTIGHDVANADNLTTVSLLGRIYLPGIGRHHSLALRANYQNLLGSGTYVQSFTDLVPRGLSSAPLPMDYRAAAVDYQLPLCYPDWGLRGIFLLKRIRLNVYYDYAQYRNYLMSRFAKNQWGLPATMHRSTAWSYGGTLYLDTSLLRLPSQADLAIALSLYCPSDKSKPQFSLGVTLPL